MTSRSRQDRLASVFDHYLVKPVDFEDLLMILNEASS